MSYEILTYDGLQCYEDQGVIYLKLDAVAKGLGFVQSQNKNGKKYESIRWERIEKYFDSFGFPHKWGKDDFIPENIFYRLAMKAENTIAESFQAKVADEIIPSIRKHGAYMTPEKLQEAMLNPDVMIQILQNLKTEQQKNKELTEQNKNLLTENKAFSDETKIWDNRSILNALVRAYAKHCHGGNYGIAWDQYYKEMRYKIHINLKIRKGKSKKNVGMIDMIKDDEFSNAIKIAVAICRENGIDPGEIINRVNAEKYQED